MFKLILSLIVCTSAIADGASNLTVGKPKARQQDSGRDLTDATVTNPNIAALYDKDGNFVGICFIINHSWVLCSEDIIDSEYITDDAFVVPNPGLIIPNVLANVGEHKVKDIVPVTECLTSAAEPIAVVLLQICGPMPKNPVAVLPTWSDFWSPTGSVTVYDYEEIAGTTDSKLVFNTNTLTPSTTGPCSGLDLPYLCAAFTLNTETLGVASSPLVFYTPASGSPPMIAGFVDDADGVPQYIDVLPVRSCADAIKNAADEYPLGEPVP